MGQAEFNAFCKSLPRTTHVVQWGGADVWKVGGKVFVIGGLGRAEGRNGITFKCTHMSYEMLKEMPGCRPAPYLASRGMTWIQWTSPEALDTAGLKDYIAASYRLVALGLPKKVQAQLELGDALQAKTSTGAKLKRNPKSEFKTNTAGSRTPRGMS